MRNPVELDEFWIANDCLIDRLRYGEGRKRQESEKDFEEAR